jgi:hypothetical protein
MVEPGVGDVIVRAMMEGRMQRIDTPRERKCMADLLLEEERKKERKKERSTWRRLGKAAMVVSG